MLDEARFGLAQVIGDGHLRPPNSILGAGSET